MNQQQQRRLNILQNHILSSKSKSVFQAAHNALTFFASSSKNEESQAPQKENTLNFTAQFPFQIEKSVREALEQGKPVVALESTIISHGMPYPQNCETAIRVEDEVRKFGAVPATIAIIDGVIQVGLNSEQLVKLGKLGHKARKCSRRDIALCIAMKETGATTVSATMMIAHMAGIYVFVTGGIGGVHHGVEETMDVSADLNELGRTPVCVVCAGVKSILDIPRTLEYLETQGVTVASYGTDEFPAFFTSKSGCKAHCRFDNPLDCAKTIYANQLLNLGSGMVLANPIPKNEEAKVQVVNEATDAALKEAREQNVAGKDVTPFLLARINELTQGESLRANIALVMNNARLGAQVAKELSNLVLQAQRQRKQKQPQATSQESSATPKQQQTSYQASSSHPSIVVIGGSMIDVTSIPKSKLILRTSNPGSVKLTFGGVARNVCETLTKLDAHPLFITAIGNDKFGKILMDYLLNEMKLDPRGIQVSHDQMTGIYSSTMDITGDMISAVVDGDIIVKTVTAKTISKFASDIKAAKICYLDANVSESTIQAVCNECEKARVPLFIDTISVAKSVKFVPFLPKITFIKPNEHEAVAMAKELADKSDKKTQDLIAKEYKESYLQDPVASGEILVKYGGANNVLLSLGKEGLVHLFQKLSAKGPQVQKIKYEPAPIKADEHIVSVTGAGDAFCGGFIWGFMQGFEIPKCVDVGRYCSRMALLSTDAVNPKLNVDCLREIL